MSLTVIPKAYRDAIKPEKLDLSFMKDKFKHVRTQSLFQIHLRGDTGANGYSAGLSMKNSASSYGFKPVSQQKIPQKDGIDIVTELKNDTGLSGTHTLRYKNGIDALACFCSVFNGSDKTEVIEMLASFNVSNMSPFDTENDTDNMILHHMLSHWSSEGRLVSNTLTELSLEDSWSCLGNRLFRIGQTGSMPANGHLPFMALEDKKNGVTYAFSIECPDAWQLEAHHFNCGISFSGGRADYNVGHFARELRPGERYTTDRAFLTAAAGDLLAAANRLTDYYAAETDFAPGEDELPILYNEFCYSWGKHSMATLRPLIAAAAKFGIDYFITDAGWFKDNQSNRHTNGDWEVDREKFPNGIGELAEEVKKHGMLPGLWFEFESVTEDSDAYTRLNDCLLRRDGKIVSHGHRVFFDFREARVIAHLRDRVIGLLKDNGFSYIKIDYNDNVGVGVDGAFSPAEGLRRHIDGVLNFFGEIKREAPGIVLEVCASGGMRLEPRFLSISSQASFSDAHAVPQAAVIAGNLHRYMQPRQMQIWATLKTEYSALKTEFVLGAAMLGRYCISGDIANLNAEQAELLHESIRFYRAIRHIIRDGDTVFLDQHGVSSYRHLRGCQTVLRLAKDKKSAVLYTYNFDGAARRIAVPPLSGYKPVRAFGSGTIDPADGSVTYAPCREPNSCKIFLLDLF
jgi:alpha-galactosidase